MPIKQLTDEQVRTWTLEQKDRWWLENVFRGAMPQLTARSAITGFLLGGLLSATNLYVGAKTGWTLGVGLTSVILAFAIFKVLHGIGLAKDFTILENNAMQSIATSAGYMTSPLISSLAAYMMITNKVIPWWQMMFWMIAIALLGVFFAFPMKRRFINDEQQPFPEGRACGVVLDTLYTSDAKVGLFKAKALVVTGLVAATLKFFNGDSYMELVQVKLFKMKEIAFKIPEALDQWYYDYVARTGKAVPTLNGVDLRELALRPTLDLAMIGAGGLMGARVASNILFGTILNYAIVTPILIGMNVLVGTTDKAGGVHYGRRLITEQSALWWGLALMVVASMVGLFSKPQMIISAFSGFTGKKKKDNTSDVLKDIELPMWISFVGVPIVGLIMVWMGHEWFGVRWIWGALAIPMVFVLSLIAANATALTSITPTGSMAKITQFTFGALEHTNPGTNLMTAGITAEAAGNASNLLMDIKPGYMLGAKPRQQAIGHCIGILAGAIASVPLFSMLFMRGADPSKKPLEETLVTDQYPMIAAVQWKGIAKLIQEGLKSLHPTIIKMTIACAIISLILEVSKILSKGKMPISPLAIGLGVLLPPDSSLSMWLGSMFFLITSKMFRKPGTTGNLLFVETQEPICAGLIAGWALMGIGDTVVQVFILPMFGK